MGLNVLSRLKGEGKREEEEEEEENMMLGDCGGESCREREDEFAKTHCTCLQNS